MKVLENKIPPPLVGLLIALGMWGLSTSNASYPLRKHSENSVSCWFYIYWNFL